MKNLLEVVEVEKRYENHIALNKVSISVPENSIYGLLGPNGAGKTSLIRIINQIVFQDSGMVYLDGKPLTAKDVQHIGYMPEERGLYKSMKVGEQSLYLAQLKGLSKNEAKKQIDFWFDRLQIEGWWDKKIEELSKGMAQKIQFMVTVLHQPKLLIFDEPFSGFDPVNALLIKDEILALKERGSTIIFSTHRMESVEEMCDSIALLHRSEKVLEGNLKEIKRKFRTHTYEVGIFPFSATQFFADIKQHWQYKESHFNSIQDELKIEVQVSETTLSSDVLAFMIQRGSVTHFSEKIPSVNDIFINAVSNT